MEGRFITGGRNGPETFSCGDGTERHVPGTGAARGLWYHRSAFLLSVVATLRPGEVQHAGMQEVAGAEPGPLSRPGRRAGDGYPKPGVTTRRSGRPSRARPSQLSTSRRCGAPGNPVA